MNIRVAEIHRLIQSGLLVPAFEEVDGEYFIYRNPERAGELRMVLDCNSVLTAFVNEPVADPDKFICDLIIYQQQRLALGLGVEVTQDDKGTKTKTLSPVAAIIDSALRLTSPDLFGPAANDGKTNVNIWANALLLHETQEETAKEAANG